MSILIPHFYRVLIKIKSAEEYTTGGLVLTKSMRERIDISSTEGIIVSMGPIAFDKVPEGVPIPKVGDHVVLAKFAGCEIKRPDGNYRIVNDEDVLCTEEFEKGETPTDTKKL